MTDSLPLCAPAKRSGFALKSWIRMVVGCAAAVCLAGCGLELYESRLSDTRAMFAHQELLNQHLSGAWGDGSVGISLRIPQHFEVLAPPEKPAADPNKPAADPNKKDAPPPEPEEVVDTRQPSYMNIAFPGLRGAFRAPLKAYGDGNSTIETEGFIYVLSNHHLYDQMDAAKEFSNHVVKTITDALHIEPGELLEDHFPIEGKAKASFVHSLKYRTGIWKSQEPISGYFREFSGYFYEQGEIQVVILFVLAKDVDSAEKLNDRIPLCLETLKVSGGNKLAAPASSSGGAAGSAPGNTSGF
jgi:hypothetical protein